MSPQGATDQCTIMEALVACMQNKWRQQ